MRIVNAVITIAIRLRYDYDPTMTYRARLLPVRRKQEMNMSIFRRSRIANTWNNKTWPSSTKLHGIHREADWNEGQRTLGGVSRP